MPLSVDAYTRHLQALLPQGAAWSLEPLSGWSRLLRGLAEELARVDARSATLIDETDPRTTYELFTDWERVLGLPDPCVIGEQSLDQRRAAIVARLVGVGGQSPAYFIAVAEALGFEIGITEYRPYDVEDDVEASIYGDDWAYAWQVNAPLETVGEFTSDSTSDEPLAWWGNAALECLLHRLKPAHTHLIFAYEGAETEPSPTSVSDDFAGTGALSANWQVTDGGITRVSGVPKADALDTDCFARWIGHVFGADQGIQMTVVDASDFSVLTLHADGNPAGSWNMYRCYSDGTITVLERWDNGVDTPLGSVAAVPAVGETFGIRRSGGDVIVEIQGTPVITEADSTYTGGAPGFGYYSVDGNAALDDAVLSGVV
jgi:uncharacterized protein YmfQ (DUF2313 family)